MNISLKAVGYSQILLCSALIIAPFASSADEISCEHLLEDTHGPEVTAEFTALNVLESLETRLNMLRRRSQGKDHSQIIESVFTEVEDAISLLGYESITEEDLNRLKARVAEAEAFKRVVLPKEASESQTFVFSSKFLPEPTGIIPDQPYFFELVNAGASQEKVLQVRFSEKAVSSLFKSEIKEDRSAALKLLKAITHGFVGPLGSNGIKRLNLNHEVLEVGFIGSQATWRLGGYQFGNIIYITHAVKAGEHGSRGYEQNFVNQVLRKRLLNGHRK